MAKLRAFMFNKGNFSKLIDLQYNYSNRTRLGKKEIVRNLHPDNNALSLSLSIFDMEADVVGLDKSDWITQKNIVNFKTKFIQLCI